MFQNKAHHSVKKNTSFSADTPFRASSNRNLLTVASHGNLWKPSLERLRSRNATIVSFNSYMHISSPTWRSEQSTSDPFVWNASQSVDGKEDTAASNENKVKGVDSESDSTNVDIAGVEQSMSTVDHATAVGSNWYDPVISYLTYLHDSTGMPWWGLIATCTIAVRFIMLPFTLIAMRNAAVMNNLQPRLKEIQDLMFDAKSRGKLDQAKYYQQEYMRIIKENDVNPFRSMLGPLVQTPVFLAFFFGLRKMANTVPSFKTGGTSWFEDLSTPDPLFVMPTLCAGIFLLNLQLSLTTGAAPTNKQWINVFRLFGLAIIPLTAKMPCAIFCYWIPSNLFSFLQNLVFSITSVRALLRLPPLSYKRSADSHEPASNNAVQHSQSSSWRTDSKVSDAASQSANAAVIGKKSHLKMYDKPPRHRHFSILLYRQQSQLWTQVLQSPSSPLSRNAL